MAGNNDPIFPATPNIGQGSITGANTARDGTGANLVAVFAPGANGSRLNYIQFHATGQTNAAMLTIFAVKSGTYTIMAEVTVTATTPSTTATAFDYTWAPPLGYMDFPSTGAVYCGITVAPVSGAIAVTAVGGDY